MRRTGGGLSASVDAGRTDLDARRSTAGLYQTHRPTNIITVVVVIVVNRLFVLFSLIVAFSYARAPPRTGYMRRVRLSETGSVKGKGKST